MDIFNINLLSSDVVNYILAYQLFNIYPFEVFDY